MNPELSFLYIYLSDRCNLKCTHCWQSAPLSESGEHSDLKFYDCKKFLDDAIDLGLRNITLSGGEPLLNPEFHKFAEYFYENNIHMSMETNGMFIATNEKILETITKCKIFCAVSLDGVNPETHNKQRGNPQSYEQTVQSISLLDQAKVRYQIIMAVSKFNYHELVPLMDWIKENCRYCESLKINTINNLGRAEQMNERNLLFDPEELVKVSEEVAALVGKYPFKIALHIDPVFISFKNLMLNYSCGGNCGYVSSLSILANGNISICSLGKQVDKYIFGNVSMLNVKDLWKNNPILADIHEDTHKKLKGICSNCIFKRQCLGGCRAIALCNDGDFFAPHPVCQIYFDSGKFPKSRLVKDNS